MKRLLIFFVVLTLVSFRFMKETETSVLLSPESKLYVEGTTNIKDFNCEFDVTAIKKEIPVSFVAKPNGLLFKRAKLTLNNSCFDCGNKGINKDFNKLLKTEQHPQIVLHLNELVYNNTNNNVVEAYLQIDMAGVLKPYKIPVTVSQDQGFNVKGQLHLNISDFHLEPPQKVFGLIKVKDVITINFDLVLKRC
ncbi:YceI family protein [Mangrovimonas cancribranchiae]|uniref:YceI family protein n=1 Tax=Mangrovimonas cancribranchiae TaxID=3080055 RepID=A0AAU6P5B1_9FLAO